MVDAFIPYAPMAVKVFPLIAPEYGEAAMQLDQTLGAVFNRFKIKI